MLEKGVIVAAFLQLDGSQVRQLIDTEQVFAALRDAQADRDHRFRGSMKWKSVGGREYLYRKARGLEWTSIGRRGPDTERAHASFHAGRAAIRERIVALDHRLRATAPVNRAMRLGRMPWVAAKILRQLDDQNVLGRAISVVGTHALYAYERMAGGHFHSSHVATSDIDLLFDVRDRLRLASAALEDGLLGMLRKADSSFEAVHPRGFRAINKGGFIVDLISPMPPNPASAPSARLGVGQDELIAAEIEGLSWLQNCPQISQIVIDERGFPARLRAPDPRAFALHKLWLSERPERDPAKAIRDAAQAAAITALIVRYLPHLRFDGSDLASLPEALRARAPDLLARADLVDPDEILDWQ